MDKQNKTYCRNPFDGVVFAPNGRMQMCCVAQWVGDPKSFTDIKDINSVNDYFYGPYMRNIRERMLQGKFVPECTRCYRDEKLHGYSERTETNKKYFAKNIDVHEASIKKINIKFGNNCNLKCKMCFPYNSSELYKEWKALGWDASDKDPNKDTSWRFYEGYLEEDYKWPKDKSNLKKLMEAAAASQVLHITGGEPTIQPEFYAFLKYLIAKDKAKNITLELVTNATKIHPSLFDLLGKFKTVMLMISMDAVGRTYEYIRYPANYSNVYENILKYRKFILSLGGESKMVFNYTLQVLNLHNTIESIKTLAPLSTVDDGFWIYELSDPKFMQWGMLPKESVKAEVKKIASHMDATKNIKWPVVALSKILEVHKHYKKQDYAKLKQQLIQFTKQQDNLRKIHIKDYIPDLVDFTNEI